jgi:hypothetical protein
MMLDEKAASKPIGRCCCCCNCCAAAQSCQLWQCRKYILVVVACQLPDTLPITNSSITILHITLHSTGMQPPNTDAPHCTNQTAPAHHTPAIQQLLQ